MHKSQAIAAICSAAENYHMNYENKQMLFLGYKPSSNHVIYVEVAFDKTNFLHLTGVKLLGTQQYNANTFYDRCLAKKLSPDDFDFAQDGTTELKLRILSYAFSGQFLNAKMMGGDFNGSGISLYTEKLIGSSRACVGFKLDAERKIYVPNTFLNDDIRERVVSPYQVIAVFVRASKSSYSKNVYYARKVNWDRIIYPAEFSYLPKPDFEK